MISGIGIDLVKIKRITQAVDEHGERFINKIFTEKEQEYCLRYKNPYPKFANKFAVKEAVCKAFGLGIQEYGWKNVEVINDKNGKPEVKLHSKAQNLFQSIKGKNILISVSDTEEYSMAFCIIET